jgi:hypothetical protein
VQDALEQVDVAALGCGSEEVAAPLCDSDRPFEFGHRWDQVATQVVVDAADALLERQAQARASIIDRLRSLFFPRLPLLSALWGRADLCSGGILCNYPRSITRDSRRDFAQHSQARPLMAG